MDGLQQLAGTQRPIVAAVHSHAPSASALPAKSPADYILALRRRFWLVLLVAVPLATAGTLMVLRMTPVYSVSAQIVIEPPKVDQTVKQMVAHAELAQTDSGYGEHYVPNCLAMLRSKSLADEVVRDPALGLSGANSNAEAADLMGKIQTRNIPKSQYYTVSYEGTNPAQIRRTLDILLDKFSKKVALASTDASDKAESFAHGTLETYGKELIALDKQIADTLAKSTTLAPGGRNLKEIDYERVRNRLFQQEGQLAQLNEQFQLAALDPDKSSATPSGRMQKIAELEDEKKALQKRIKHIQRVSREGNDPALVRVLADIRDIDERIADLRSAAEPGRGMSAAEVAEAITARKVEEIEGSQNQMQQVLAEMKEAMPEYQKYITLISEREQKAKQIAAMQEKLSEFRMMAATQKPPVEIVDQATEPEAPIRPKKAMYIAGCIVFCLALGMALVCFLEYLDNSVKVPEHLTAGLALPLFGVVPRIRREARNHRGGHLWTHGTPESIEADAFRNLRASLLGAGSKAGPIVTLLVTSAKAGEGKSTTALNLAATCARAGERTLLMDVDLRRPSLVDVFPRHDPEHEHELGLVDVLRGDLPWQRTVVQSEIPNLDFLPTGDTRDVPVEVLGSLELRQLLLSLSQHHYDRVILDGPAVLGLADCRMLGRIVDASVLVVRSGSQGLRPLQRAKTMLEQSQVHIAGLVFNGLSDDLQNWSSYGPNTLYDPILEDASRRASGPSRGLDAPASSGAAAALMAAGPAGA